MSDLAGANTLTVLVLVAAFLSFVISASAGLGGSLLLVPTLALAMGSREGVALAALLLAGNNVFKVFAYRSTLPWKSAAQVAVVISLGAAIGATLLVNSPEELVGACIVLSLAGSLWAERRGWSAAGRAATPVLAFSSGATSGFSGTSGPLKGAALRNLGLDRSHFVGAASLASLAGDLTKTGIFSEAQLLDGSSAGLVVAAVPLMLLGTALGLRINRNVGERGFAIVFWTVMTAYSVRLVVVLG